MSEKKTLVEQIKALVFSDEITEEAFLDVKTSEGIVLRVESLEEGQTVTVISEDGENVSGASEYVLEDGMTIVVDEAGVITSVEPKAEEEEETEEEMSEEVAEPTEKELATDKRIGELTDALKGVLDKFAEVDAKIEKFAKLPADEAEKDAGKTVVVKHSKDSALIALAKFRNS